MDFRRTFVVIAFALFVVVSAKPNWQPRIIGGEDAKLDQLPYMAGIFHFNGFFRMAVCSGAILNSRVILSSASCIEGVKDDLKELVAVLGSPSFEKPPNDAIQTQIDQIILHPQFNVETHAFDLSLLRTSKEIEFSNAIRPITLPVDDLNIGDGLQAVVGGWGILGVSFVKRKEK